MAELSRFKQLGPKSERCLDEIGIRTRAELEAVGAVGAGITRRMKCGTTPSLNFLYALVGAPEGKHRADVARTENKLVVRAWTVRGIRSDARGGRRRDRNLTVGRGWRR